MILKMDITHIDDIVNIEKICFNSPWSYENIKEELNNPKAYIIVFRDNSKILGYAGMYSVCGEGYIYNIAVLPDFRNRGIAKSLLDDLLKYSFSKKLEFLSLEVRVSNIAAINLYSHKGFENMGIRKSFYSNPKEDAFIMTKFFKNERNSK